ncbi:hypothetical protein L917_14866 [Phytophthora nicotianae]|uniref:Uncharacterized protein n=1 Tax=Phytophthora nicotianae TaxID=4792 RepID=W2IDQ1_PHYNI|nr:hypothetical protein L915_15144 [Phytophthora nicotianae]ETL32404.1 hypothetical protein L916_15039 [Phytophthora nicotianae]ETL85647.1 hypothetical protein L917_14866 [Phytophthora nicotianae]ETM38801.1 hypothetical protein L914_15002 [Phytophthora nicotianae]
MVHRFDKADDPRIFSWLRTSRPREASMHCYTDVHGKRIELPASKFSVFISYTQRLKVRALQAPA